MSDSSSTTIFVNNKRLTRELAIIFSPDSGPADKVAQLSTLTRCFMTGNVRVALFKRGYPLDKVEFMSELFTARGSLPAYTQACDFVKSILKLDRGDKIAAIKLSKKTV